MSDATQIATLLQGGLSTPSGDGSRSQKANIEQAWLRELERAQLDQLAASNVTGRDPASGRHSWNSVAVQEQGRVAEQQAAPRPAIQRGASSDPSVDPQPGSAIARQQTVDGLQRLVAKDQVRSVVPVLREATIVMPKRSSAWEAAVELRLWSEVRHWERRKAYVVEREGRVKVWLRDAELKDSSTEETIATIRKMFQEAGMDVDEITVNGHLAYTSRLAQGQRDTSGDYRA